MTRAAKPQRSQVRDEINSAVAYLTGQYLIAKGVKPVDFNQYGTRRGNLPIELLKRRRVIAAQSGKVSRQLGHCQLPTAGRRPQRSHVRRGTAA